MRGAQVVPPPDVTCLHRVSRRRGQAGGAVPVTRPAVIPAMKPREHVAAGARSRRSWTLPRAVRSCRGAPGVRAAQRFSMPSPAMPRPWGLPAAGQGECLAGRWTPKSCAAPNSSGRAPRRSRNTMRVKPYAIRFPSRNARHTALSAPGGCMSTSGCSCRYRSSLRTCSGGPGGTSCTGQYRYPAGGQRNGFPKSPATRHRRRGSECPSPPWTCRCA